MKFRLYLAATALALATAVGLFLHTDGTAAPQSSFLMIDGSRANSSLFNGKVTLVNFWATSCTTCVAEMPKVIATYEKFNARGFETIAVAMRYDPAQYVVNFAQTRKLPFHVALDNTGELARAWGEVQLTPTTFLVDKHGMIVKRFVGEPDFPELHRLIEQLLTQA